MRTPWTVQQIEPETWAIVDADGETVLTVARFEGEEAREVCRLVNGLVEETVLHALERALRLVISPDKRRLAIWAHDHGVDRRIVRALVEGYRPSWKGAAEYRGALVAVHREIARTALSRARGEERTHA